MSSESSDDENLNFLKEAQDSQFLNDSMFSGELDNSTSNRKENIQKSLRKSAVDDEHHHHHYNSLKAQIKESLDIQSSVVIPKRKRKHGGVKLFASSQKFLKLDDECEKVQNRISKPVPFHGRKTDINIDSLKEVTMSHMPPFRLNVPMGADMPPAPSNPKKRRKNAQAPIQPSPSVQDLLPPPLSGYGDTIVASNPFDDCPSNVNMVNSMARNHGNPMGMQDFRVGPGPNMVMGNSMMYRPMCPNPPMGMMHSPNAHQMNGPMMMNGPRMGHMGHGPPHGPPHMMSSPNGAGGGGPPMGPNMNLTGPPMHSPIGNMGPMGGQGPGNGPPMGSPMGGPMNGGGMNNPMNGPPSMGGPQGPHGPHGPPHGAPGNMPMSGQNGPPHGPPMNNNNNFIMSPMNNMYSKPMPVSAGKIYPVDQPMVFNSQNPNAPPIYPCGVCHKEVHDNDQAILCESGCNFWFHRGCTGLTEAAFQLLTAEVYAEWVCDKCLQSKNIPLVKFKP